MSNQKTYEVITERIIQKLEAGVIPWRQPWSSLPNVRPANVISRKPYRGINHFMTHPMVTGFSSPFWLTFKQAKELGGSVRKGEKGTPIIYASTFTKERQNDETGQIEEESIPFLKYFTVFNVEQCDGLPFEWSEMHPGVETRQFSPIETAERILEGMPNRPRIEFGSTGASYNVREDLVRLPAKGVYTEDSAFYATAFHELAHSTRHTSRLNRKQSESEGDNAARRFGCVEYAKEELCAEITSAFLCSMAGIDSATLENSAAYVDNWLSIFKKDVRLVISAASQAQKAADYILGNLEEAAEKAA